MSSFAVLVRTEAKLFLREPMAVFWAIAFPPVLFIIFGCIPPFRKPDPDLGGLRMIDLYVPVLILFVVAMTAVNTLPATISLYRERGVLRRLSTTPMPASRLLLAQVVVNVAVEVVVLVLVMGIGRIAFDVALPRQPIGYLLAFLLVVGALLAVGMVVAAVAPNTKVSNALGMILFFPLMFFSGLWLPVEAMPSVLRHIAEFTPPGAGVQAFGDAAAGSWPGLGHLAVLVGYGAVFGTVAVRLFRWDD